MDDCIDATKSFKIYIITLWIPLNFIGGDWGAAHKTLHGMSLALEIANERGADETGSACNCNALWGAQVRALDQIQMLRLLVAP